MKTFLKLQRVSVKNAAMVLKTGTGSGTHTLKDSPDDSVGVP